MSIDSPITPTGNTVVFTAAVAAPTAVQALSNNAGGSLQYEVINAGGSVVFMGWGATAATAGTNAALPASNTTPSMVLLPGSDKVVTLTPNLFFTGVTINGASNVYVLPGSGA